MRKLTLEYVRAEIEKRDGTLLSEVYVNADSKLHIKCNKDNYIWYPTWHAIQRGYWCPKCGKNAILTIEELKNIIESKNGTLLSTKYKNSKSRLEVRCDICQYYWNPTSGSIVAGHWCPNCAGTLILTLEKVREIVENKDGILLSDEYINARTPLKIQCNKDNYIWYPKYSDLQRGCWCPKCANNAPISIEEISQMVQEKGGILLTTKYESSTTPLKIQCKNGHIWYPVINSIRKGHWCSKCAGWASHTFEEVKQIVEGKGGILLSDEYKNSVTPIKICCASNHIFDTTIKRIKRNQWCPSCYISNKTQKILQSILENILSKESFPNYKGFDWLKTSKYGKQELDIYFPQLKLAVEYDGEQHFIAKKYFGGKAALKKRKQLDSLKNKKVKQHPEDIKYFLRFNYKEKITKEYVLEILKEEGII